MPLYLYLNYTWSRPEVEAATSRSEWDNMDEGSAKETENGTEIFKKLFFCKARILTLKNFIKIYRRSSMDDRKPEKLRNSERH